MVFIHGHGGWQIFAFVTNVSLTCKITIVARDVSVIYAQRVEYKFLTSRSYLVYLGADLLFSKKKKKKKKKFRQHEIDEARRLGTERLGRSEFCKCGLISVPRQSRWIANRANEIAHTRGFLNFAYIYHGLAAAARGVQKYVT